jgi:methylenetetrahydrofolate reductase (NADPH)
MMHTQTSRLSERIAGGKTILLAEISPPQGIDPAPVRDAAKRFAGKVHAVGVNDNRDRVAMSALAAAALVAAEGLEPILHITTRDRNRIALISEALGAQALGISNLLCTSGSHQTLGRFRAAKNVYDIDSIQLLQAYADLASNGKLVGEESGIQAAGPFCLAAVAAPYADPMELQITRLKKKTKAGAALLITQPIYDVERFGVWWKEVTRHGIHEQAAIVASIQPLTGAHLLEAQAGKRPSPRIPAAITANLLAVKDPAEQRAKAIDAALETITQLGSIAGLRGFCISSDGDLEAALQIIDRSGLRSD